MKHVSITVNNAHGLHARPANLFTREAQKFTSKITFEFEEEIYNAKSIIEVLSACVVKDSTIKLMAEGDDEDAALEAIAQAVAAGLGES